MKKIITPLIVTLLLLANVSASSSSDNLCNQIKNLPEVKKEKVTKNIKKALEVLPKTHKYYNLLSDTNTCLEKEVKKVTYEVKTVVDGDTVYIIKNGKALRLRMIGIDAPESTALRFGYIEEKGKEATQKLKELIGNNKISLEYDISQGIKDKHGRDLVYIFIGNRNINKEMIASGYAKEYTYTKPYKYQKQFKEAQKIAESKKLGIWEEKIEKIEEVKSFAETNYTGRVKGNISTKTREKIYHIPGCPSYTRTRISISKGERYFNSEEEARKAGWRKAKNCD